MDFDVLRRSYDRFAHKYDEVFWAQQRPKLLALLGAMGGPLPSPALDLGAGTGLAARETGHRFVQLDASPGMLAQAPPHGRVLGDLYRLPFADDAFALALSITALIHFTDPGPAIAELARVLRPRGRLALSILKVEATDLVESALAEHSFRVEQTLDLEQDLGYVCRLR